MPTALEEITLARDVVRLPGGDAVAVQRGDGPLRPFVLVSDAEPGSAAGWEPVARRLLAAGHQVLLPEPAGEGGVDPRADRLSTLIGALGLLGGRAPVLAGRGREAAVALSLAARRAGVAGVCCLGGGWDGPGLLAWAGLIAVPVLLCPVIATTSAAGGAADGGAVDGGAMAGGAADGGAVDGGVAGLVAASRTLPQARVSWYAEEAAPARLADDLLALASAAEPDVM